MNDIINNDFTKIIRIELKNYNCDLISRSIARKILKEINPCDCILLDFLDVDYIGQGFADEIFRVYKTMYTNVKITYSNTTSEVEFMIKRAQK